MTPKQEVNNALRAYSRACSENGLIPEGMTLVLSEGSRLYGRGWRVNLTGLMVVDETGARTWPKGSGHDHPPCGDDYLGGSAREAAQILYARAAGIWAGANARRA